MSAQLAKLLEAAKQVEMTEDERERQRRSFAFGNASLANEQVTRALVDRAAEAMPTDADGLGRR